MIRFDKAKLVKNAQSGKKGLALHKIQFIAQVTEESAKALGDDIRNTLYNSKGIIRPSFSQMDTRHVFAGASIHLSITGVKDAELRLADVLVHRFRIAMRGDGEKKAKTLVCGFEVEYINRATGTSSIDLWNFVNRFIGGQGALKLTYPEQQSMFTEGKEKPAPPITPGLHRYDNKGKGAKVTAEIQVTEVKDGWGAIRKARVGGRQLQQKAPNVSPSEAEAIALAAYDVRQFADKCAAVSKGVAKKEAEALSSWAQSFAGNAADLAKAGPKAAADPALPKTVTITRRTS